MTPYTRVLSCIALMVLVGGLPLTAQEVGDESPGSVWNPPPCVGIFADLPCPSTTTNWIEALFNDSITTGCLSNPLRYCPTNPVTRQQMAIFLERAMRGTVPWTPGDITAVTTPLGSGLTGGAESGDASLAIASSGVLTEHLGNAQVTQAKLAATGTPTAGQVLGTDGSGLAWQTAGNGTVTSVGASGGTTGLTFSGGPVTTSGTVTLGGTLALGSGGTGAVNAAGARTALGLGTMATQAASAVAISGGTIAASTVSASGGFTGDLTGNVSGSAASFTGSLAGEVTGPQGATTVAPGAITRPKLGVLGPGTAGHVLGTNGTDLEWQPSGLAMVIHTPVLTGDGSPALPLDIADAGVGKAKLAAGGGAPGQVLATDGSNLLWQPSLPLPFVGTVDGVEAAFYVTVTGSTGPYPSGVVGSVGAMSMATSGEAGVRGFSALYGVSGVGGDAGVVGTNSGNGGATTGLLGAPTAGVRGDSSVGNGVLGQTTHATSNGVYGEASQAGAYGVSGRNTSTGTWGYVGGGAGVYGEGDARYGVLGKSASWAGVRGESTTGNGVEGVTSSGNGVFAVADSGFGLRAQSGTGHALYARTDGVGMAGVLTLNGANSTSACLACAGDHGDSAGDFVGNVFMDNNLTVTGTITKGGGSFRIDHPLDPENRYLYHSFVESPDMKNVYDGVVVTDTEGVAVVELPEWFEALNRDFRYQLTVIGRFAQAIVEQEVKGNRFTIRTNLGAVKVSWQVTGIRKDPFANAHRIPVEQEKPVAERGTYLHAEAWGQPPEKDAGYAARARMAAETAGAQAVTPAR